MRSGFVVVAIAVAVAVTVAVVAVVVVFFAILIVGNTPHFHERKDTEP